MLHPGGSSNGERWLPLAYWVGWAHSLGSWLASTMNRESSGQERVVNHVIDCTGLMQIWPGNIIHRLGLSWEAAVRWLMVAENNLRAALWLYYEAGVSPWAL